MKIEWPAVPYDVIDRKIVRLVRTLNRVPGIHTAGSCGGHKNAKPGQAAAGEFWIKLDVERNMTGWTGLEFLAWAINHDYASDGKERVFLWADSYPPYINDPGHTLVFLVYGRAGASPNKLAAFIDRQFDEVYISPQLARRWRAMNRKETQCAPGAFDKHAIA